MFTAEQLLSAHEKVKTGADFPAYIQEIKKLGVTHYETFVADGQINYYGTDEFVVNLPKKHETVQIAEALNPDVFKQELLAHQQGKTDFSTFIKMCAATGVSKWEINIQKMICTYFDRNGNEVLAETIPA